MRAVVTGGAGHIGSHLTEQLVASGACVRVVDDLSTGRLDHLAAVESSIDVVINDICDPEVARRVIDGADVVFHLAAAVGVRYVLADPISAVATNLDGTRRVVDACRRADARLVFASTSEVYGKPDRLPMTEDDPLVIGGPQSPRWSYALTKALDEHLVLDAGRTGLPVSILRYFNSYGRRASLDGDGSVVARFARQAAAGDPITIHGTGDQVRCFTHVDDVAAATLLAGTHAAMVGQVCNVGSPFPITVARLADLVARYAGGATISHVDPTATLGDDFDETHRRIPSIERINALTGWTPTVGLRDGLAATVAWYRDQVSPRKSPRSSSSPAATSSSRQSA